MRRWLGLAFVMLVAGGALYYSNRHEADTAINPNAIVNLAAQTQRELSRLPMEATRISDAEEIQIGDRMAANEGTPQFSKEDAAIQQYVEEVGARIVGGSTRSPQIVGLRTKRHLVYHFHYIPSAGLVNAYALPGGHVFIGKGLIALMDSEDELATILGHEVEHIDLYHCAERVQIQVRLKHLPLSGLVELPIELFQVGYQKDEELEADRQGALLASQAGYSAAEAIAMFERFARGNSSNHPRHGGPLAQVPPIALQSLTGYFRSHPFPEERLQQMHLMIDDGRLKKGTKVALRVKASA